MHTPKFTYADSQAQMQPSPFAPISRSFAREPLLGPGTPLYAMLAWPEDEGWDCDNSEQALFSRLFDEQFQSLACLLVPDCVHLRKICLWIVKFMSLR